MVTCLRSSGQRNLHSNSHYVHCHNIASMPRDAISMLFLPLLTLYELGDNTHGKCAPHVPDAVCHQVPRCAIRCSTRPQPAQRRHHGPETEQCVGRSVAVDHAARTQGHRSYCPVDGANDVAVNAYRIRKSGAYGNQHEQCCHPWPRPALPYQRRDHVARARQAHYDAPSRSGWRGSVAVTLTTEHQPQ